MKKLLSVTVVSLAAICNECGAVSLYGRVLGAMGDPAEPIIGASVTVSGTTNGTMTNEHGGFYLSNVSTDQTITITMLGYCTTSFTVTSGDAISSVGDIYMYEYNDECKPAVVDTPQTAPLQVCQGKVMDRFWNGLAGVSVAATHNSSGTTTDIYGVFTFANCLSNSWYYVNIPGYVPRYVWVTPENRNNLNIILCEDWELTAYSYSDMTVCDATCNPGEYLDFLGSCVPCPGDGTSDGGNGDVTQCYTTPAGGTTVTGSDATGTYEYTVPEKCYILD